jgi:putative spermidine/putrescine transport system substrate-binding protein
MASCWEPVALVADRKAGDKADIRYGTMKAGHQIWNNLIMLTKGGQQRGMDEAFYKLANVNLSLCVWCPNAKRSRIFPQMTGVQEYMDANPKDFDQGVREAMSKRLENKQTRYALKGNAWQNVFLTNLRAYQDWWVRLQAA